MKVTLTPCVGVTPRCAVCHDAAVDGTVGCPGCRTLVHPECAAGFGCPTLGCVLVVRRPRARVVEWRPLRVTEPESSLLSGVLSALLHSLVVLGALAFGAASVTVPVMGQGHTARVERVRADMRSLDDALERYTIDAGLYPQQFKSLWERPADVRAWNGPYLQEYPPRDPWGTEYVYVNSGRGPFALISYGADGQPGGTDEAADLSSRTINERDGR